jgi:hypothetical protein
MLVGTFGRVMVLAAIAVLAGVGLCLFDAADAAGGDLCTSPFTTATPLLLAVPLGPTGTFVAGVAAANRLYSPDLPSPPPKA